MARAGAHISVAGGGAKPVRITGSNDEETIVAAVAEGKAKDKGTALVSPGPVAGFLATFPDDVELTVASSETHLNITRDGGKPYSFVLMSGEYPDTPQVRGERSTVAFDLLSNAINAVRRSVGEQAVVQMKSNDDDLALSTTDNYRLSQCILKGAGFGEYENILQLKAMDHLANIGPQAATFDKKALNAISDDASITIRSLANAAFPDLSPVLTAKPDNTIQVERQPLLDSLKRISAVDADATASLAIDQDSMSISLTGSSTGQGQEDVEVSGGPDSVFIVSINLRFLLATVESHKTDQLTIGFTSPDAIVFFRSSGDGIQTTTGVMPVADGQNN